MNMVRRSSGDNITPTAAFADRGNQGLNKFTLHGIEHNRRKLESFLGFVLTDHIRFQKRFTELVMIAIDSAALVSMQARAIGSERDVIGERSPLIIHGDSAATRGGS